MLVYTISDLVKIFFIGVIFGATGMNAIFYYIEEWQRRTNENRERD